ncbi:heat shock factor protein 3 isoform X3 [Ciconia boyciana]|uniref:heat shock factor protein 3 isoform X3 n=1 Tax=Ciconia boyciana TaxID=52775 RepID=UPI003BA3C25F
MVNPKALVPRLPCLRAGPCGLSFPSLRSVPWLFLVVTQCVRWKNLVRSRASSDRGGQKPLAARMPSCLSDVYVSCAQREQQIRGFSERFFFGLRSTLQGFKEIPHSIEVFPVAIFLDSDFLVQSQNGENFCILDEQRFAKELLPKYFKHNNISSFIRQLNMYGFRKVIALENGMITAEKSSVIEFQHPFFKQGKAHLLENIKRKVSAVRTEDLKVCTEDLHKVLSEVQEMREQQNNMDVRLANMKRENKALWKEVAVLRQKHSQQQKLLSKILQFILSLMRGNYIVGVKRKRSLTDAAGASASKYSRQYVRIPVESGQAMAFSEHNADDEDGNGTGLIIRDITDTLENATDGLLAVAHTSGRARETQAALDPGLPICQVSQPNELNCAEPIPPARINDVNKSSEIGNVAVELHSAQPNAPEDPVSVIDSILNENNPGNQNDPLLDREEIQDFLNCIDASLEELQAMLSGKQYNFGSEAFSDTFNPELPALDMSLMETSPDCKLGREH